MTVLILSMVVCGCSGKDNIVVTETAIDKVVKSKSQAVNVPDYNRFVTEISEKYPTINIGESKVGIVGLMTDMKVDKVLKEFEDLGVRFYINSGIDRNKLGLDDNTSGEISIGDLDELGIKSYDTVKNECMSTNDLGVKNVIYGYSIDGSLAADSDISVGMYNSLRNNVGQSLSLSVTAQCKGDITLGENCINFDSVGDLESAKAELEKCFENISILEVDDISEYDHYLKASTYNSSDDEKAYVSVVAELKFKDNGSGEYRVIGDGFKVFYEFCYKPDKK